ncbi:hypothetical protein [Caudoviricetes sp.]|nr:hypothetical protein [Caudoviricetes sp.]
MIINTYVDYVNFFPCFSYEKNNRIYINRERDRREKKFDISDIAYWFKNKMFYLCRTLNQLLNGLNWLFT